MNLSIQPVDANEISDLQADYRSRMTGPQDAYWQEGLIAAGDHFQLDFDHHRAGYFVTNADNQLMQFHLGVEFQRSAPEIFKALLNQRAISQALAATIEPGYFSLCLDSQTRAHVHTLLFSDQHVCEPTLNGFPNHQFRSSTEQDLPQVLAIMTGGDEFIDLETVDAHFSGPLGYAKMVVDAGILHVLEFEGKLVATGELRKREDWVPYADVGMIVHQNHRRRGLGTYMLCKLKQVAQARNLQTICSCEAGNIGSRKSVENAGFNSDHRVVLFDF